MSEEINIQGRRLKHSDIEDIRHLIEDNRTWNRTKISKEICIRWNWSDPTGRHKDIACRAMLRKLEKKSLLVLPKPRHDGNNQSRGRSFQPVLHDTTPIQGALKSLGPISIYIADNGCHRELWQTLMQGYHYLGFKTRVGKSICYLAMTETQRPVGAFLFGAAAWKTAARDRYIGWNKIQRETNLDKVVNNHRFLIPPWVQVPHLASHLLGRIIRRLTSDWETKYAHSVVLAETFVEKNRFKGTCYKAANWIEVGKTTGRTRNDVNNQIKEPIKAVLVYPLCDNFRTRLIQLPS